MKKLDAIMLAIGSFGLGMVLVAFFGPSAQAQGEVKVYKLADLKGAYDYSGNAVLYKVQDGSCSVYAIVGQGSNDRSSNPSVATGQGCQSR